MPESATEAHDNGLIDEESKLSRSFLSNSLTQSDDTGKDPADQSFSDVLQENGLLDGHLEDVTADVPDGVSADTQQNRASKGKHDGRTSPYVSKGIV